MAAIPEPAAVMVSAERLAAVGGMSALILVYIGVVTAMFDQTFAAYYERYRKRLARVAHLRLRNPHHIRLAMGGYAVASGTSLCIVEPTFGLNWNSALMVIAFAIAVVIVSTIAGLPFAWVLRHEMKRSAPLRPRSATLPVTLVCAGISRAVGFTPGILYGMIAGYTTAETRNAIGEQRRGQLAAFSAVLVLSVSTAAWILWSWIHDATGAGHESAIMTMVDAILACMFLLGLQGTAFQLIPIRPFDGFRIFQWHRRTWVLLEGVAVFGFILVLLTPSQSAVLFLNPSGLVGLVVVLGAFGLIALGLWSFGRRSAKRLEAAGRG